MTINKALRGFLSILFLASVYATMPLENIGFSYFWFVVIIAWLAHVIIYEECFISFLGVAWDYVLLGMYFFIVLPLTEKSGNSFAAQEGILVLQSIMFVASAIIAHVWSWGLYVENH